MQGHVYKSTGSFYQVKDDKGCFWQCKIRGRFKIDSEISSTNPIAVGDLVIFETDERHENEGLITDILPRNNYMVRTSPHNKNQKHIVAANIDQAVLIATIKEPRTSWGFIDRFLLTAEMYHIPATIVFNKADLLKGKYENEWLEKYKVYTTIGYDVYTVSTLKTDSLQDLQKQLHNKISLFSGHSGVGKSSLINLLLPEKQLKVKNVSDWSGKGQHTTTFAEMFDLPTGGSIIDTPGVKEFGIVAIEKEELSHYFPEMRNKLSQCKFNNCMHLNEPECAVKAAVISGEISSERYNSYCNIYESIG